MKSIKSYLGGIAALGAILTLVFVFFGNGAGTTQAQVLQISDRVVRVLGSASPDPADTSVTISVSGTLSGQLASADDCIQDVDGQAVASNWWNPIGTQTVPSNAATITAGPFSGQSIPVSVNPGQAGTSCTNHGSISNYSGSRTFNTTGLPNGTHTITVRVEDDLGSVGTATVSFTVEHATVQHTLTVTKSGTGSGTVTSSPTGVNCGSDCSQTYSDGAVVSLIPTPATGSVFSGWSGNADCSDNNVTINANKTCNAIFDLQASNPPTVDIKAREPQTGSFSDGPITIPYNTATDLEWTTGGNPTSCTASGAWSGAKSVSGGTQSTGNLTGGTYTYTIACSNPLGTDSDSVTITVPTELVCSPPSQTVNPGQSASMTASGGAGAFAWSAPDGSPSSGGNSSTFTTTYSTTGSKTVTVTRGTGIFQQSAMCSVGVGVPAGGTITVLSNLPTTWTLSGPEPRTQSTQTTSQTYTGQASGSYTLAPASKSGYTYVISPCNTGTTCSRNLADGSSLTYTITYSDASNTVLSVQSNINGSLTGGVPISYVSGTTGTGGTTQYGVSSPTAINTVIRAPSTHNGNQFAGWTGCSTSNGGRDCNAVVTQGTNKTVTVSYSSNTAKFNVKTYQDDGFGKWNQVNGVQIERVSGSTGTGGTSAYSVVSSSNLSGVIRAPATHGGGAFQNAWGGGCGAFGSRDCTFNVTVGGSVPTFTAFYGPASYSPATVVVESNVATTWELTGPSPQTQGTASLSESYSDQKPGTYTLTNLANLAGYDYPPAITPSDSQSVSGGNTITFTVTYSTTVDCADGVDNDGDGFIDADDPGCVGGDGDGDGEQGDPPRECADGVDNADAEDSLADEADPGCHTDGDEDNPASYDPNDNDERHVWEQCRDTIDNDGDGLVDYPSDPGCTDPRDDDEVDPTLPICGDGLDNDEDGLIDFPDDPGCTALDDGSERDPLFEEF